ncbi:preprotein translocase subunit SecA [Candidatus Parcubacteria bacterium]|nr:preprotein translocase subunit SecA [Candidatus Parcubacteria bacterium]
MSIFNKIFGDPNEKIVKKLQPIVDEINGFEEKLKKMSDEELKDKTEEFKKKLGVTDHKSRIININDSEKEELNKKLDEILPEAFAVTREASRRVLKLRHYDVQLVGGIILHKGQIAEMKTGEGKTLVATLPLYLNGLTGRGVQLITVNDYLSRIGAGSTAPVFHLLGLTTAVIAHESALIYDPEFSDNSQYDDRLKHFRSISRQEAYDCDILYGTNNEFGFDYLRDNMASGLSEKVQRELNYSIVDEIDSILIDEARTPLIISAPAEKSTDRYYKFAQLVSQLSENKDYNIDEKMRASTLTEEGISKMEKWLGIDNIYTTGGIREVHHIEQALKAHALFKREKDYVVQDNEVIIVDEFTGRLMHGRRYSEGLHQAIEAKEKVEIQRESQTLATITFQNYFRMYEKLSGMTGTAATEAEEFAKIYKLETVMIPTNEPTIRKDLNDLIYKTELGKFKAVIKEVKERSSKGQPILIGTISIEKNEMLLDMMIREGLKPLILNAKNHEKEGKIISEAGKPGSVTIATNMAGRGVDIMLGGTPPEKDDPTYPDWEKEHEKVVEAGGLLVIGTERHESRRIDNQLRGRSGRQGDPGESRFYISGDDDLMRIFGGDRMKSLMTTLRLPEDMPIENKLISRSIESAQKKVEGNNFDMRKHLVEYDDVINKHRESIYKRRNNILALNEELSDTEDKAEELEKENNNEGLSEVVLEMVQGELEQVVYFHTAGENINDWNLKEIKQVASTIFPVTEDIKTDLDKFVESDHKHDQAKARTEIIEYFEKQARNIYTEMKKRIEDLGVNWKEIEKSILIRSIDTLWVEHLYTMSSVRQGIGLRGYGQRDPLVEYKKEAYRLYHELNGLIQKEVVYSVYKVGMAYDGAEQIQAPSLSDRATQFTAPAKIMSSNTSSIAQFSKKENERQSVNITKTKAKNEDGTKIGRNDPCPCGSGKKYKKCCGR